MKWTTIVDSFFLLLLNLKLNEGQRRRMVRTMHSWSFIPGWVTADYDFFLTKVYDNSSLMFFFQWSLSRDMAWCTVIRVTKLSALPAKTTDLNHKSFKLGFCVSKRNKHSSKVYQYPIAQTFYNMLRNMCICLENWIKLNSIVFVKVFRKKRYDY